MHACTLARAPCTQDCISGKGTVYVASYICLKIKENHKPMMHDPLSWGIPLELPMPHS